MPSDTSPKIGYGIVVTWGGHDIGYLVDCHGPSMSADSVEISNHDSANGFKEFVSGMRDGGEFSLTMKYIPGDTTGQKQMLADFNSGTARQVVLTFSDTYSSWTAASCIITSFDPDAGKLDSERLLNVTLKVSGKPVYAYT